nr:unnamed protein product [Callosobruchus analis]
MGKRGQIVPVIITPDLKSAIDFLIRTRSAVVETDRGHLRGHDCLRLACTEANLIHPECITGTKLRKYVARVYQIINLGDNEQDWVARHLGHDITVHRSQTHLFRLHENAVETIKISHLLLAVEKGEANRYTGKSLDEINIDGE